VPRDRNIVGTKKLHLSTTTQVLDALDALVRTGLFGKTRTEVAEELLRVKVREAVSVGWLERSAAAVAPKARVRKRRG
jgi:hypothetical protein